ncbi:MAG: glutathione S-transferase family protein [Gammaproteobacteria bacterium]|nr:glutathione S-transferase family protein [Gammaproteobacteria bacterium]MXX07996.1 glutathione S-transferase family protein [Gammaproteobacteria bacterium]MYE29016.1 glutathione S-transferase family protein [Gammaproteobacteria bacterium]MYI01284.1 glutathione S-transferase family protein [Gammaproteobacteria bacterium]
MSIKLYGINLSNYYCILKAIMLEKGMAFEEVEVNPNQDPDYLTRSPMGKVPCIETDQGFLTETGVIIDYFEALGKGPSFYPDDPFARAKVQELMRHIELYIELPARRLYGEVFFGRPPQAEEREAVRKLLERGFASLGTLASFDPWLAGDEITYADFYFRFTVSLATVVCRKALDWDAYNNVPNVRTLIERLNQRESIRRVMADQAAA